MKDSDVLERLQPQVRKYIKEIDFASLNEKLIGLHAVGFGRPSISTWTEVFIDGKPLNLSRWPNDSTVLIGKIKESGIAKNGEKVSFPIELGEISPEEFRKAIRKEVSEALSDHEIDDMWNLMLLDIPREKLDLLLKLREHYMVYLLSNTNRIHWDYACEQMFCYRGFRVNDFFEDIFLSFEMHKAKPEKDIYEQMMKEANILPEETFFYR